MTTVTAKSVEQSRKGKVRVTLLLASDYYLSDLDDRGGSTTASEFMKKFLSDYEEDELLDIIYDEIEVGTNARWEITITDL